VRRLAAWSVASEEVRSRGKGAEADKPGERKAVNSLSTRAGRAATVNWRRLAMNRVQRGMVVRRSALGGRSQEVGFGGEQRANPWTGSHGYGLAPLPNYEIARPAVRNCSQRRCCVVASLNAHLFVNIQRVR
jgi:hypothetical protein